MEDVVRAKDGASACLRCGAPITYKGRGRRPVWCSTNCRVQASVERKGNRVVGVEPRVVRVLSPKQERTLWESEERKRLASLMTTDVAIAHLLRSPNLIDYALTAIRHDADSVPEARREWLAARLRDTADSLSPPAPAPSGPSPRRSKRDAVEWAELLEELATELASNRFYDRDLPTILDPLLHVNRRYEARIDPRSRH